MNNPPINFHRSTRRQLSTQKRFATVVPVARLENPYVKRSGFGSKPSEWQEMEAKWQREAKEKGTDFPTIKCPPCVPCY